LDRVEVLHLAMARGGIRLAIRLSQQVCMPAANAASSSSPMSDKNRISLAGRLMDSRMRS